MRIPVGVLGAVLSLPWVTAFGVFRSAHPPSDRTVSARLGWCLASSLPRPPAPLSRPHGAGLGWQRSA